MRICLSLQLLVKCLMCSWSSKFCPSSSSYLNADTEVQNHFSHAVSSENLFVTKTFLEQFLQIFVPYIIFLQTQILMQVKVKVNEGLKVHWHTTAI